MNPVGDARRALTGMLAAAVPDDVAVHADPPQKLSPPCMVVRSGGGRAGTLGGTQLVDMRVTVTVGAGDTAAQVEQMETLLWTAATALRGSGRGRGGTPPSWSEPVSDGTHLECTVDLTVPVS